MCMHACVKDYLNGWEKHSLVQANRKLFIHTTSDEEGVGGKVQVVRGYTCYPTHNSTTHYLFGQMAYNFKKLFSNNFKSSSLESLM